MRLIDADKLIEKLEKCYDDCDIEDMLEFASISNFINRQPTAYDVDKVLEQLEEESILAEKKVVVCLDEAIEIVEAGVTNE